MKSKRVIVGLSGGVDSAVTAHLLLRAEYDVVGAFIRTWHPPFVRCTEEEDRLDAFRVSAHLSIPCITIDARKEYEEQVAQTMIREYAAGRTPNPDILCNRSVKFSVLDRVREDLNALAIATGHYARIVRTEGELTLCRGVDPLKDQSYFLSSISRSLFPKLLFPLGDMTKEQVRAYAARAGLPNAARKDSQGICFLGEIDMRAFLRQYVSVQPGQVLDTRGEIIGTHDGALLYTRGERHGFTIHTRGARAVPHYVVSKNVERNTLTVSTERPVLNVGARIELSELHPLIASVPPGAYHTALRYHMPPVRALYSQNDSRHFVTLAEASEHPSAGQTCVLYRDDVLVASGIIES